MSSQTNDTIIDYIASLGEYAADHAVKINNIHKSLIEKMHYLEDDVVRNELQKLEHEVLQQLSELEKSIGQVGKHTNTKLSSAEGKILNSASKQIEELKEMRSQLYTQIEQVERKISSLNTHYHQEIVRKIDINQKAVMTKLDQNLKKVNQDFNEINNHLEGLSKKVRFGNVVSTLVLGVLVGLIIYLYSTGVIL
ncbi:hypothetical protein ACFSCX_17020 [Bacillus salitolerans]|uniref:Uncharacterized protein n=1 Tax=Bacillus salitolerans TaxID=1437434 RepID=A0ABW4LST4_9BACI